MLGWDSREASDLLSEALGVQGVPSSRGDATSLRGRGQPLHCFPVKITL